MSTTGYLPGRPAAAEARHQPAAIRPAVIRPGSR
jgi:hypothetical protein